MVGDRTGLERMSTEKKSLDLVDKEMHDLQKRSFNSTILVDIKRSAGGKNR